MKTVLAANGGDTGYQLERVERQFPPAYESDIVVLIYVLNDISDWAPEH